MSANALGLRSRRRGPSSGVVVQGPRKKVHLADEQIPLHAPCELVRNALKPALATRLLQARPASGPTLPQLDYHHVRKRLGCGCTCAAHQKPTGGGGRAGWWMGTEL